MKFTDTTYCKQGRNCLNCRMSQGVRNSWKKRYEVPDDFDERCPLGKSLEQIKKEHPEKMKMPQQPQPPPMRTKIKNFSVAMKEVAKGLLKGRKPIVPDDVLDYRITLCESNVCGYFDGEKKQCAKCGCGLARKLALTESECPVGVWKKHIDS